MARDPMKLNRRNIPLEAYDFLRKWFTLACCFAGALLCVINAPFGRFVPTGTAESRHPVPFFNSQALMLNGKYAWIFMELVAPITFFVALKKSALSFYRVPLPDPFSPQGILVTLFLVHYLNRALLGPLRTPSRSKTHIVVTLVGIAFNLSNGYLMGSYLSSPYARIYAGGQHAFDRTSFRLGIVLWGVGFIGNLVHDEILLDIRRKAQTKREKDAAEKKPGDKPSPAGEYYGIPSGLLYEYISYPNYFCEWIEWFGFALAASPLPIYFDEQAIRAAPSFLAAAGIILETLKEALLPLLSPLTWVDVVRQPPYIFAVNLTPPWIFLVNEIMTMLPRAIRGHGWYKQRFGDSYPKDRKAIIPFLL